jgi:hypothetical protein
LALCCGSVCARAQWGHKECPAPKPETHHQPSLQVRSCLPANRSVTECSSPSQLQQPQSAFYCSQSGSTAPCTSRKLRIKKLTQPGLPRRQRPVHVKRPHDTTCGRLIYFMFTQTQTRRGCVCSAETAISVVCRKPSEHNGPLGLRRQIDRQTHYMPAQWHVMLFAGSV